jgi:hypothetical protein
LLVILAMLLARLLLLAPLLDLGDTSPSRPVDEAGPHQELHPMRSVLLILLCAPPAGSGGGAGVRRTGRLHYATRSRRSSSPEVALASTA